MAIKLSKEESLFRNELIFIMDHKGINIDNTFVNLFMLLKHNGERRRQRARGGSGLVEISNLKNVFSKLEEEGIVSGFKENPEAGELWLRSNLLNMTYRGNIDKEKISSLRPIHLESYRVRNSKQARDYNSADQVYLMLSSNPLVREDLKNFLLEGWDQTTNQINSSNNLDVDSLGILQIIKKVNPGFLDSNTNLNQIKPLLKKQSELYCDDVRRLLIYKNLIPRNVLIDYLKNITSLHLSIYFQKLVYALPKMVEKGTIDISDNWNIVIDATDSYASRISKFSVEDAKSLFNNFNDYIKATYQINATFRRLKLDKNDSKNLESALKVLKEKPMDFEMYFETVWDSNYNSLDEEDKLLVKDLVKYENTYFDRYIELILKARGKYLYKFNTYLVDYISQKNSDNGIMAQGRSKKHPRKFVLGTRLLETLVQILVLEVKNDHFITKSLSIEELIDQMKDRYGLIINGLKEERFKNPDINTNLAFKENVEAFKHKLREIGFYNDLSDAYILQKIRSRYKLNTSENEIS